MDFPGGSDGKESLQCRRSEFDPWVGKIPWRRGWQPTLVFLPGESHGQRSVVGYSPQGHRASDITFISLLPLNYASFTEGASLENQSPSSHFDNTVSVFFLYMNRYLCWNLLDTILPKPELIGKLYSYRMGLYL